jgi:hypothetical protein
MLEITLTEEQAQVVAGALQPVQLRDPQGNVIAIIPSLWTEEDLDEIDRRWQETKREDCLTTAQMLEYFHSLEKS